VQVHDGEICALPLSADLRDPIGKPLMLFRASEATWIRPFAGQYDFVTDGPFLYRANNGQLLMLWSSFGHGGYTLGVARSLSGTVIGPWTQDTEPLYTSDGGHGMLFHAFDGQLMLALHQPNSTPNERPVFIAVEDRNGTLSIRK
jgi:hypothetical protein